MKGKSLPARIALISSLIGATTILACAALLGSFQKTQMERQAVSEALRYAERFTTWTLGYFYQQDNLLHLETQQKFLSESENIVYSYIVKESGLIDVGIDGVESSDIGATKQPWESQLPLRFDLQATSDFTATKELALRFRDKLVEGDKVLLVGFPISCPERETPCAQLRVALVPQTARGVAGRFTLALASFGLLASLLTGAAVYVAAVRQVRPLRRLTGLMELTKNSGNEARDEVRKALATVERHEAEELRSLRESLLSYLDTLELASVHAALARSAQAFAHDVRRPFTLFKAIISTVEKNESKERIQQVLTAALPEVDRAMADVDGLIQDIMQIGSKAQLTLELCRPEELIENAVRDAARLFPAARIALSYAFSHGESDAVEVDVPRVLRVFANLLGNAIEAVNGEGSVWFNTQRANNRIRITMGNSGSRIKPEDLRRIFDVFYTSGKRGGVGLGLAIVKSILAQHGSEVTVVSEVSAAHPQGYVEFSFSLPLSDRPLATRRHELPASLQEAISDSSLESSNLGSRNSTANENLPGALLGAFTILVVDDDRGYAESLRTLFEQELSTAGGVDFHWTDSAKEAMRLAETLRPGLILQDRDLGAQNPSGIDIARALRQRGFTGSICLHTSFMAEEDMLLAIDSGIDRTVLKPLTRSALHDLFQQARERETRHSKGPEEKGSIELPTLAYVDDSKVFLAGMRARLAGKAVLHGFASSAAFLERLEEGSSFLFGLDIVVLDLELDAADPHNGETLATELRRRGFVKPLLLCTSGVVDGDLLPSVFDGNIQKGTTDWAAFKPWLGKSRSST